MEHSSEAFVDDDGRIVLPDGALEIAGFQAGMKLDVDITSDGVLLSCTSAMRLAQEEDGRMFIRGPEGFPKLDLEVMRDVIESLRESRLKFDE